jgi:Flp pilus assembly pilin Flp
MVVQVTKLFVRVHMMLARLGDESGATAVEYALMLTLIAMAIVVAVQFLGRSTSNAFDSMTFTAP